MRGLLDFWQSGQKIGGSSRLSKGIFFDPNDVGESLLREDEASGKDPFLAIEKPLLWLFEEVKNLEVNWPHEVLEGPTALFLKILQDP